MKTIRPRGVGHSPAYLEQALSVLERMGPLRQQPEYEPNWLNSTTSSNNQHNPQSVLRST